MLPELSDEQRAWYILQGYDIREQNSILRLGLFDRFWFKNNLYHREDGPAIEWADGDKWYYLFGQKINDHKQIKTLSRRICDGFDSPEI